MRVYTNVQSMNAQRNLSTSSLSLNKSLERLSSGLRINRAGDDAAGLAISEKLERRSAASVRVSATPRTASR